MTPKISIVTISYNAEAYIERTIKSVVTQTYPNIEYIIIDGASKDNTVQIIKQYEEQVDTWISEPDKSHFDAMNKGLERATGDYVLFMNAGDCIHKKDSLANMVDGANGADLIYSRAEYITEDGEKRPWHKTTPLPSDLTVRSFLNGMVICHHCMLVKRSITPPYKLAPWKVSNDIEWAIRVMKNVKTTHFWDDTFCLYLDGGISADNKMKAVKERFNITVVHFGWISAIFQQFVILFQLLRRGRLT